MKQIVSRIVEQDRMLGDLCTEAMKSYENRHYFAALACLFVAAEQSLKAKSNAIDGQWQALLDKAMKNESITREEYDLMNDLKHFRNKLFHESHYSLGLEFDGLICFIYEDDAKKLIFEKFAEQTFRFIEHYGSSN